MSGSNVFADMYKKLKTEQEKELQIPIKPIVINNNRSFNDGKIRVTESDPSIDFLKNKLSNTGNVQFIVINEDSGQKIKAETAGGGGDYAPANQGVENGNNHDHNGGDGAQINHVNLANKGINTHAEIDLHIASIANPHAVTKTQVGLSNVTNDSQLKRSADDFISFPYKATLKTTDIILIEDSDNAGIKSYTSINSLPNDKIKVSSNDSTRGYLNGKLMGTANRIELTELNNGLDETLKVDAGSDIIDKTTSAQIYSITQKAVLIDSDIILGEDSANNYSKIWFTRKAIWKQTKQHIQKFTTTLVTPTGHEAKIINANGNGTVTTTIPDDFGTLIDAYVYYHSAYAGGAGKDIDLTATFCTLGELANTHVNSDSTSTYTIAATNIRGRYSFSQVLTNLAANDILSLYIKHNGIGGSLYYTDIVINYYIL